MKTSTLLKSISLAAVLGGALALPVLAQPGPGMWGGVGMGMGMGMGMQNGGPGPSHRGPGARGMGGGVGATLMSPEERTAMQTKMRAVKTYDECKLVQDEQHKNMQARAQEKGITLPAPRQNRCDMMKSRGLIG